MIALACAMLPASNCHAAPTPVEPVGYVVRAQGLNAQAALAEIVASGQKSFSQAMRGWEHSAEHKRNLLLPEAQAAGIAVRYRNGRAYYTLVLGAE
jgi:uncharacterized protein YkwD